MNTDLIRRQLSELNSLVESWSNESEVSAIERDVALDKVKSLYEELRFADRAILSTPPLPPQIEEEPEIEVELTYYEGEDEEEIEEQIIEEQEPEEETEEPEETIITIELDLEDISIIPDDEPATPEPTSQRQESVENALFDIETIPIRPKSRRSAILSLYSDDTPATTPTSKDSQQLEIVEELHIEDDTQSVAEPAPEKQEALPIIETEEKREESIPTTLGETLTSDTPTIADKFASQAEGVTLSESQASSSLNDRYIIAQELFGGDMEACEEMLSTIDGMDNFDDCMIYIVENYDWNPDDEATKLVLKFLELKFPLN